jgi:hypothetical protein
MGGGALSIPPAIGPYSFLQDTTSRRRLPSLISSIGFRLLLIPLLVIIIIIFRPGILLLLDLLVVVEDVAVVEVEVADRLISRSTTGFRRRRLEMRPGPFCLVSTEVRVSEFGSFLLTRLM